MHQRRTRFPLAVENASQVHQTTRVRGDEIIHIRCDQRVEFASAHPDGYLGKVHGKSASESTAPRIRNRRHHLQPKDRFHQLFHMGRDVDFPARMASDMQSRTAFEFGSQRRYSHMIHEKFAEFKDTCGYCRAFDQVGIMASNHGRAGARRAYNGIIRLENLAEVLCKFPSLVELARVEVGLTATGLLRRIVWMKSGMLEQAKGRHSNRRIKRVHEAGNEETESHVKVVVRSAADVKCARVDP